MLPEFSVTVKNPVGKFDLPLINNVPPETIVSVVVPFNVNVFKFNVPLTIRLLAPTFELSVTVCVF